MQQSILILVWPCRILSLWPSGGGVIYSGQIDLADIGLHLLNLVVHTCLHTSPLFAYFSLPRIKERRSDGEWASGMDGKLLT